MTLMSVLTKITALAAYHLQRRDTEIPVTPTGSVFKPIWSLSEADHHKRMLCEQVSLTIVGNFWMKTAVKDRGTSRGAVMAGKGRDSPQTLGESPGLRKT